MRAILTAAPILPARSIGVMCDNRHADCRKHRWKIGMDVAGFRFAVETLEKGRWSVLCLMADDIAAARMAYS